MDKRSGRAAFLIILAAALITAGVVLGQPSSVLTKAATICLECVGIG